MRKILAIMICLSVLVFTLTGCSDKGPPPLGKTAADLSEDVVDGKWDVWLEVWKAGDRSDVYRAKLRFNVFSNSNNLLVNSNYGVCSFSIETKKADKSQDRFSDLPGFQPRDVYKLRFVSAAGIDVIDIWSDEFPEYTFRIQLTKNDDGFLTGYGEISFEEEGGTIASLHVAQVTRWSMGYNGGLLELPSDTGG